MRRPAKLEAEIAALAAEVEEVARTRGRAFPNASDWVDLFVALGVTYEEMEAAVKSELSSVAAFSAFLQRPVTPAAEPLQQALVAVEKAALPRNVTPTYRPCASCEPLWRTSWCGGRRRGLGPGGTPRSSWTPTGRPGSG